jgi:hypothetical protein
LDKISGYKTYAIAIATLAYAVGGVATKHLTLDQAIQLVLASGAVASLRHGIETKK